MWDREPAYFQQGAITYFFWMPDKNFGHDTLGRVRRTEKNVRIGGTCV